MKRARRASTSSSSSSSEDEGDDPFKKVRKVEHVDGNFATFVFVDLRDCHWVKPTTAECGEGLRKAFEKEQAGKAEDANSEKAKRRSPPVTLEELPHVSISKGIQLRFHFIEGFLKDVGGVVRTQKPFDIHFGDGIRIFVGPLASSLFRVLNFSTSETGFFKSLIQAYQHK